MPASVYNLARNSLCNNGFIWVSSTLGDKLGGKLDERGGLDDVDRSFRWRFKLAECLSRDLLEGKAALQPSTLQRCISFRWTF